MFGPEQDQCSVVVEQLIGLVQVGGGGGGYRGQRNNLEFRSSIAQKQNKEATQEND